MENKVNPPAPKKPHKTQKAFLRICVLALWRFGVLEKPDSESPFNHLDIKLD